MSTVDADVMDNVTKMTKHILNPDMELLAQYGFVGQKDEEEGGIENRISLEEA